MTPAEVVANLRVFNDWRRGELDDLSMPDPREIGEAIDAAVEMVERFEAAESECLEQARLSGMGSEREAALMAKLESAEGENTKLRKALTEKVISETMLRNLSLGNGSINASFEGGAVHLFVDAFATQLLEQFLESGATNYLEMSFHSNVTGPLVVTLQRVNGKTAHQLRAEAEKERDALRAKVEEMEKQEPVAYLPLSGAQPAPSGEDDAVRKSWARFSNELHRSPDAPYPGMSEAFEKHFSQSFTAREWRAESGVWAAAWKAAKNHGAQPAPSVPECPYPCGWQNLLKHAIEDGAYLARSINEDEPVTENARAVVMRMVMRLRDVLMAINNAAPEAKP